MKRNVTLAIDENLLERARMVCQKRNLTLTKFVRSELEKLVHRDVEYQDGMRRMARAMKKRPITVGERTWTRDDLHER